jgi:CBS domain-containing protein
MFKPISKSDITVRPFKVFKNWTLDYQTAPLYAVEHLSGSFEDSENREVAGYKEYSLYKSINQLFYANAGKQVGVVTNWNLRKHNARKQTTYEVKLTYNLATPATTTYLYYYSESEKKYIDEFQQFLDENKYSVNDNGIIFEGKITDITKVYGLMDNYGSLSERKLGDRFLFWNIPQRYIGEGIKPNSLIITDYSTISGDGYTKIVDDGKGNLKYLGKSFVTVESIDIENETITFIMSDGLTYIMDLVAFNLGNEEDNTEGYFIVSYNGSPNAQTTIFSYDVSSGILYALGNFNFPLALSEYNKPTTIGNIFYSNGIITLTQGTQKAKDSLVEGENYNFGSGNNWDMRFQSTKTIYENEVFLEVNPTEFNYSTNPSATKFYNGDVYVRKYIPFIPATITSNTTEYDLDFRLVSDFDGSTKIGFDEYEYSSSLDPTGSYLAPYITTVGLYDENYDMVAVAKIPSKPKSAPDYPINFVIRFDT